MDIQRVQDLEQSREILLETVQFFDAVIDRCSPMAEFHLRPAIDAAEQLTDLLSKEAADWDRDYSAERLWGVMTKFLESLSGPNKLSDSTFTREARAAVRAAGLVESCSRLLERAARLSAQDAVGRGRL